MASHQENWESGLEYVALTDIGMRRTTNQDSHVVVTAEDRAAYVDRGHFFMVADGMGAHAAGELASKLTVDGVAHLYRKYSDLHPSASLEKALGETNAEVHRRGQANSDFRNMGTTASVLVLLPEGALVAHIGDSRVYRLRGNSIEQLTFDHSLVWELRKAGQISSDEEVSHSIPKNVITRSVGPNASVQVDLEGPFPVLPGDTFLLCSDGLTGKVDDTELAGILAHLRPEEAGRLLIDLANLRGGPDNITAIVTKVTSTLLQTDGEESRQKLPATSTATAESAIWITVAVGVLVALVLSITDRLMAGLVVAVLSGLFSIAALIVRRRPFSGTGGASAAAQKRGRGPYTKTDCPAPEELADKLSDLTHDLRQRDPPSFPLDWSRFDESVSAADSLLSEGCYESAICDYAMGIRALMVEVRAAERQRASDSALDL